MAIKIGINAGPFADAQSVIPGISTCRSYRDDGIIPTVWPIVDGATTSTASFRPDLDALLNDTPIADNGSGFTAVIDQLKYLADQAPGSSKATIWHEAGNLYKNNPQITAQKMRQAHVKCYNAVQGTNIAWGVIIYGTIADMDEWIPGYPHSQGVPGALPYPMNWYGIDPYDNLGSNDGNSFRNPDGTISDALVRAYMDEYRALAQGRTGVTFPQIDVNECNSPIEANRGPFFTSLAHWLFDNGGRRMQTFYKLGGSSGGAWDPADSATIQTLNNLCATYGSALHA